jgi:hypothetical protein
VPLELRRSRRRDEVARTEEVQTEHSEQHDDDDASSDEIRFELGHDGKALAGGWFFVTGAAVVAVPPVPTGRFTAGSARHRCDD